MPQLRAIEIQGEIPERDSPDLTFLLNYRDDADGIPRVRCLGMELKYPRYEDGKVKVKVSWAHLEEMLNEAFESGRLNGIEQGRRDAGKEVLFRQAGYVAEGRKRKASTYVPNVREGKPAKPDLPV